MISKVVDRCKKEFPNDSGQARKENKKKDKKKKTKIKSIIVLTYQETIVFMF